MRSRTAQRQVRRRIAIALLVFLVGLAAGAAVLGFAEEDLPFRDPITFATTDEQVSTIHFDLAYLLALAAGFTEEDAARFAIWNQLVDSEEIGPGDVVSYTNCTGAFSPAPEPRPVCPPGTNSLQVAWPQWDEMKDPDCCVSSRFGPYSPFFHFPHQNDAELGALRDWGEGITDALRGYAAYAWGGLTVMQATCTFTVSEIITTGIPAGSLEAFATYLHSLADSWSHLDCIAAMDALGKKWATHTLKDVPACNYVPSFPTNGDAHGREFGTQSMSDSMRTDAAIRDVYTELVERSLTREGRCFPLSLDTPLNGIAGSPTFSQTLYTFVHEWEYNQPSHRRDYVDELVAAVLAQRREMHRVRLPVVSRQP